MPTKPPSTRVAAVSGAAAIVAAPGRPAPAPGAPAAAPTAVRICHVVTVVDQGKLHGYSVRIDKGKVTCARARTVLHTFLAKPVSPRGWFCARGHASQDQKWAAQCANQAGAVIKAFGPLKG